MFPTVWLKPGILIIYGSSLDAENHQHNAIQVVWPSGKTVCQLEGQALAGPLVINSQVEHELHMASGWVLLIEPQCELGEQLSEYLAQQPAITIPVDSYMEGIEPKQEDNPAMLLAPLFSMLGIKATYDRTTLANGITDKRIETLLANLDHCLPGDCQKPIGWRANEVANQLSLSESRFLHLFREQMGIAWRPYLLWRRTICAIGAITKGKSATEAAHIAGFSDSAHLSRTFRSLFGISIREAKYLGK